jgi:CSLREA domain-containing protein
MRLLFRAAFVSFAAVMVLAVLPAGSAFAVNTYTVTTFSDPLPGVCVPGDCSLREAVIAANASAGHDTIRMPAGAYNLIRTGPGGASQGDLDITDDVTLQKTGGGPVAVVDGHGPLTTDRVFEITNADAVFHAVSARNGIAPQEGAASDPRHGGGIRVNATATLQMTGGAITSNTAPNTASLGGGLYNAGQVILTRVNVQTNKTDFGFGGGIFTPAAGLTIVDKSVIRDNTSGFGGGFSGLGTTVVANTMLRGNAAGLGGAGYISGGAAVTVANSTVAGNIVTDRGGAFRVRNATFHLEGSTVSDNEADLDGGGIAVQDDAGAPSTSVVLKNSILAGNTDNDGTVNRPDCYDQTGGLVTSSGGNVVGNQNGCSITAVATDDIGSQAAPFPSGLQNLAFNGGPLTVSLTFALKPLALARNNAANCEPTDQRGVPRNLGGQCDSGAYEEAFCNNVLINRVGTPGADKASKSTLKATGGRDGFIGLNGDDSFKGGGGNDGICGGPGHDVLTGGTGGDTISGGPGPDRLIGGPGNDTCKGGSGTDTATGCEHREGIP